MYRPFIGKAYANRIKIDGRKIISLRTGPNTIDPFITPNPDIEDGSILDILSVHNLEFTEVRYKPSSGSLITGFVKTIYLRLVCECCLQDMPSSYAQITSIYISWQHHHKQKHHPIKKIGRYEFQLLYKFNEPNYQKIKIRNITQQQIDFIVYPSNSQGNIYRFCSIDGKSHIYKGNDYVTETFIHMDLQEFINHNIGKLIEFKKEICPTNTDIIPHMDMSYKEYMDKRLVKFTDKFLDKISELECGKGFSNTYKIIGNIINIYKGCCDILSINHIFTLGGYMTLILRLIGKGSDISKKVEEFNELYLDLFKKNRKGQDSGLSYDNKHKIMRFYLEFISYYMNSNFDIKFDSVKQIYSTGEFLMKKDTSIKLNFIFFSVIVTNKISNLDYTIIYAKYKYENSIIKKFNGSYTTMLNMIPHGSGDPKGNEINSLGLYKNFTTMGIYLCKSFDYGGQVRTMAPAITADDDYYFLGHVYTNLFPVKQITEHEK
jgi:hypothetical protein